jgi:hypothetical protein
MAQAPLTHDAVAFGSEQAAPHAPQLATVVSRLVSQPLLATLSQLPQPVLHEATVQALAVHAAVALARLH